MSVPCPAVLALLPSVYASTLWRVQWPFRALQCQGAPVAWAPVDTPDLATLSRGRAALLLPQQRWFPEQRAYAAGWVAQAHRAGVQVWTEWDDDVVAPTSRAQLALRPEQAGLPALVQADCQFTLALSDGVTVSTEVLAAQLRPYTAAPIVVIPNALDWDWWRGQLAYAPPRDPRLTVGWAGSKRLAADWALLTPVWAQLAARYPAVHFVVAGYCPPDLPAALPPGRLTVRPYVPLATYPQNYAGIDIFCCPLADTPFNAAKSPIKAWEAGCAGAAVVASPTVYGVVLQPGRTGLVATTAAEWEAALAQLIEDAPYRGQLAARWHKRVRERYSLTQNLWRWPTAWAQLLRARARVGVA